MASYLQGPFRADGMQGCELFGRFTRCNRDSLSVRVYPEATIFMDVFPQGKRYSKRGLGALQNGGSYKETRLGRIILTERAVRCQCC